MIGRAVRFACLLLIAPLGVFAAPSALAQSGEGRMWAPPAAAPAESLARANIWGTPGQEEATALTRINARRTQVGLSALSSNLLLQAAARGHANYELTNNVIGHDQDPAKTGFTGITPQDRIQNAGYTPAHATGEVIALGPFNGDDAVENLIEAIYHRVVIFASGFDDQGAGISRGSQGVTVVNFGSMTSPPPSATPGWVGVYPSDGQTGVSVDFYSDEESPDPVPGKNRVGYPVSVHIDTARNLTVTSFTLTPVDQPTGALGTALPVQLLSKATGDAHMPAFAAAIVPVDLLAHGLTYEASFAGTADGSPIAKTWRFTTAPFSSLAIAGPATVFVGDTVTLAFSGGSGRYTNVGWSYTAAFSQPAWAGTDDFSFQVDSTGNIDFTVTDSDNSQASLSITVKSAAEKLLPFAIGWNLVGNSTSAPLHVATVFADATMVSTVWKWEASKSNWAFYSPALADGGAAYAASKGYGFLTSIDGGEGFWVNAKGAFNAQLAAGTAVSSAAFQSMGSGWNLIAVGDNPTPSAFNKTLSLTPPAAGEIPLNVTTLWAWDSTQSNWYFYAPSLEKSGGLAAYIASKSYLDFATKTLDLITGFWVNKP